MTSRNESDVKQKLHGIAPELVQMVYRGVLGRPADPSGLATYTKVVQNTGDIEGIIKAMLASSEFRELLKRHKIKKNTGWRDTLTAKKYVFIHIEKTVGTSLQNMLIDAFGKDNVYHEHDDTVYWRSPSELAPYTVFSAHFNYDSITCIPSKNVQIFTFVRDPKKRLVSLYTFLRSHTHDAPGFQLSMELANQCDIDAFFKHEQVTCGVGIWNHMTWCIMGHAQWLEWRRLLETLIGKEHGNLLRSIRKHIRRRLREFLFVGLQEDFDRSVNLLFSLLSRPCPPSRVDLSPEQMMSDYSFFKRTEKPKITPETDAILDRLVELDNLVYQEAKILYEERLLHYSHEAG